MHGVPQQCNPDGVELPCRSLAPELYSPALTVGSHCSTMPTMRPALSTSSLPGTLTTVSPRTPSTAAWTRGSR
jgi:hypothetical protein